MELWSKQKIILLQEQSSVLQLILVFAVKVMYALRMLADADLKWKIYPQYSRRSIPVSTRHPTQK